MTLRDSSVQSNLRKNLHGGDRNLGGRLRVQRRRRDRRLLSEMLEQRQLLAGPDLIGIQPNDGQLIRGGEVLTVSPRELVFRFDDQSDLDPRTIAGGISITRAGEDRGFESATGTTDLGTGGTVLVEFIAAQSGARGNGIEVRLRSSDRGTGSQQVNVTVNDVDRIVTLDLNSNPNRPSQVQDVIRAVATNPAASALIEVVQVSGPSLFPVGTTVGSGIDVLVTGANAAQSVTDLGTSGQVRARFLATVSGQAGVGTTISVRRSNLNLSSGQLPFVSVSGKNIQVILDSTPGKQSTVNDLIAAINSDPDASSQVFAQLEIGDGNRVLTNTAFSPLTLVGATDTVVAPGFVGLGDTPHEVVFRFSEALPQDTYQIEVFGSGPAALRNVDGEAFNDGNDFGVQFSLNNAPQVAAVVPAPVRRQADGTLAPEVNVIDVYFNEDIANATDLSFYKLEYTRDTATNLDDPKDADFAGLLSQSPLRPRAVTYDPVRRVASLQFTRPLSRVPDPANPSTFLKGAVRLRIGTNRDTPDAPTSILVNLEPADTFNQAFSVGAGFLNSTAGAIESFVLSGEIDRDDYELQFPGGSEVPGVRNIRPEDPSRLDRTIPLDVWRTDGDADPGITTVYYDFPASWIGDNPNLGLAGDPADDLQTYFNLITEQQKQRIREVVSLYSQYLGVQFVETRGVPRLADGSINTADPYVAIAVGELRGAGLRTLEDSEVGGVTVATRPLDDQGNTFISTIDPDLFAANLAAGNTLLVMDFQDFDESVDDQLGGEFFRGAFLGVGQLLGYGYADHLPQPVTQATGSVLNPGLDNEPSFPSPSDIVNGQYLFRPESNDVDLYRISLTRPGKINIQTVAERLQSASALDTALRLYQKIGVDATGQEQWSEIAANDDYFSNDSLLELNLPSGVYIIGVSASGNTVYDPNISGSGIGGSTEGQYDLRVTFQADGVQTLRDQTQVPLDGDMDGRAGGEFNYWFLPSDPDATTYVDSSYQGPRNGLPGSASNPLGSVADAVRTAGARYNPALGVVQQVRVVGGQYSIGLSGSGIPADGSNLDLPRGVQLVIDAGSAFRMRRSRIGVGSTTEGVDRSNSSIQVLGVPGNPVVFTAASGLRGDWGGIDIRGDIDASDGSRINPEENGVFLNHIQYADISNGGGPVSVDGRQVVVSPIEMAVVRPTIMNSRISGSADAAIAATPDSLAETRFDEFRFQRDGAFTPDYMRAGPHIRGNEIEGNTIDGVFLRLQTRAGDELESLRVTGRVDDIDVVHVLAENLVIEGNPGGPTSAVEPPSVLLLRGSANTAGSVAQGSYVYRLTFFNRDGYETAASNSSLVFDVPANGRAITLTGLPAVPQNLRDQGFVGRRLYRAPVVNGTVGTFREVSRLNSDVRSFVDAAAVGQRELFTGNVQLGRFDPSLTIDPGAVFKFRGSRIDVLLGSHLYAEGTESLPIVMTSISDNRYGAGGTFDTVDSDQTDAGLSPGDWGGVYLGFGAAGSFDHVVLAGGGGPTRVEGGFGSFNPIEVHQAELRVANSRFEENADGRSFINDPLDVRTGRVGRGENASATIFVRASQPVIINNEFVNSNGPVMSFDINSFTWQEVVDTGRSTGMVDALAINGNSGPLIQGNRIGTTRLNQQDPNQDPDEPINRNYSCGDALGQNPLVDQSGNPIACSLNGLEVRGGEVATELVLDDVDIVHIVRDTIEVPNQHIYGGLRLESDARGSLVVKFQNQDLDNPDTLRRRQAGIVVGGTLITAEDQFIDIDDRIGGSLQVVGHPDFPVILTALVDDTVGAGFTPDGRGNFDTDNNGRRVDANGDPVFILTSQSSDEPVPPPLLPLGQQYDRTDLEEFDNANLIDNDIDPFVIGFLEAQIEYGSQVADDVRVTYLDVTQAPAAPLQVANLNFLYTTFIDVDVFFPFQNPPPVRLADTLGANPPAPVLIGDDRVRSTGTFLLDQRDINPATNPNRRRLVEWTAESFILNSRGTLYTTLKFETLDNFSFNDSIVSRVDVISYLDQGIPADDEDILYSVGTPGQTDFRALTINRDAAATPPAPLIGFSHGGIYNNDNFNQVNAQYLGWAADVAPQLLAGVENQAYSATGVISPNFVPTGDPLFDGVTPGTLALGEDDIATSFAWRLTGGQSESRVTTFVEFFPSDPVNPFRPQIPPALDGSGTWDGLTIREAASDANVAITSENEPRNIGNITVNDPNRFVVRNEIPGDAQFLGELASSATAGDNLRRLGFIVEGTISQPSDLDVYSFIGEAGTQVWLDIDRTNSRLDTVVELIDANGRVRVLSDNSLSEARDPSDPRVTSRLIGTDAAGTPLFDADNARALGTSLVPANSDSVAYQDLYSTNPRDAGMRLVLPGNVGQRFLYHVRVRSSHAGNLLDAGAVRNGKTSGAYQLQMRLKEQDVFAGTQVRYSDVRFAVNGVQIIGGPNHSPILADEYETQSDNNTRSNAQRLGLYETLYDAPIVNGVPQPLPNPGVGLGANSGLNYDRNASNAANDVQLQNVTLENPAGPLSSDRLAKGFAGFLDDETDVDWFQFEVDYKQLTRDATARFLSTVFDLDYADGASRANTSIYVFDQLGQLVMVGTDSNIADDQPPGQFDVAELSRGSFGNGDPFIGSAELLEGTYFVAVSNQTRVPTQLEQFFLDAPTNPLLRLEPIDSVRRIAEDRIYRPTSNGLVYDVGNYAISLAANPVNNPTANAVLINSGGGSLVSEQPITLSTGRVLEPGYLLARDPSGAPLLDENGDPVVVGFAGGGTAGTVEVPVLFDSDSIVQHSFDDSLLYVNTRTGLFLVNPFTGAQYGLVGGFGGELIRDVAFRANGELFAYTENGPVPGDAASDYVRIDTSDATLNVIGNLNLQTFHLTNFDPTNLLLDATSDVGIMVEAITIREFLGGEDGYLVGNRPVLQAGLQYSTNILYEFNDANGSVVGPAYDRSRFTPGAGTSPREIGQINTTPPADPTQFRNQLGITNATEIGLNGVAVPSLRDGDNFTLSNVTETVTFEFDQSFTLVADGTQPVRDGDAVIIDGVIFEFDAGSRVVLSDVAPVGQLTEGTTVTVGGTAGSTRFEFVRFGQPRPGNVGIRLVNAQGLPRPIAQISAELASGINTNVAGVSAQSQAGEVFFSDAPTVLSTVGAGATVVGSAGLSNAGAIRIEVAETINPESLIAELANAIREAGIPVSDAGTQLSLPTATSVVLQPDPAVSPSALTLSGMPGVMTGNVPILLTPTDSAATIAERISIAVQAASDSGDLPNVSAIPNGRSLNIVGGFVVANPTGNLVAGGVPLNGVVQGIELVNNQLYAVTSAGELYEVNSAELTSNGNRTVGRYVPTATDLIGINFTGLRAGPVSVDNGALSQILFGITGGGEIYAFNTRGELQPVFAGERSVISTGIGGALGLDFSVVDFNLWHVSGQRGGDDGHGINATFNSARPRTEGSSSLAFTYENNAFAGNYPSAVETPTFAPRLDGSVFEDSYNVPGGAKGVVQSNPFSLEDYASADLPTLYFNYFMETEGASGRDALRVYVVTSDGVEHLVATNSLTLRPGTSDDEFDDPDPVSNPAYSSPISPGRPDDIDADVQPLFNTGSTWRQARVPLGEFAGRAGLSLRIEFSTSGETLTTSQSLRAVSGQQLTAISDLEFVINDSAGGLGGESFTIELAPTVLFPSGLQLSNLYASSPSQVAIITIDGTQYVLNDGTRPVAPSQQEIDLLAAAPAGTTLAELSAAEIAETVASQIFAITTQNRRDPNSNPILTGFNFSDPTDDPNVDTGRNDFLYEATPLPYNGGNQTITGSGRLGTIDDPLQPPTNLDDVDLVRLEVKRNTLIAVDVDLDFNSALNAAIRFFDAGGNELITVANPGNDTIEYTATSDGVIYIGISGLGNETYDPRIPGTARVGQIDSYTASVSISLPSEIRAQGNLVEFFGGQQQITASPAPLFAVMQPITSAASTPVRVSRFMSAEQVATEVQRAIANRFTQGNTGSIPTAGPTVRLPGLFVDDSGPLANERDRYGFDSGAVAGTDNNDFEGVYLDDFIIGFAERGELATGAVPEDPDQQFVNNGSLSLTNPPRTTQQTDKGAYQLEIRDASEYVSGGEIVVTQVDIQRFAAAPIVIPINGVPYGVANGSVPNSEVIPASQRPPFQIFNLPTVDVVVDPTTGEPITSFAGGSIVVELDDNDPSTALLVPLIELDSGFKPLITQFTPVVSDARFRVFNTNDRLSNGFSVETLSGSRMVDGASFFIFDSLNQLTFEFDVRPPVTPGNPNPAFNGLNDPTAVVIEIEAEDSAAEVASKLINTLNSQNVQAALDVRVTRANTTVPGELRDFSDSRVHLYGDISFVETVPGFATVTNFEHRGDANRDRSEQGVIIVENSRFLFNSDSGIAIVRDAEARAVSGDQRDEFPVALTYPQNLLELNSEGLVPGVVVQNNVVAFNANNGILITGIDGGGGAIATPVGFDKIINNTVIGGVVEPGVDLGTQIFSGFLFSRGGISFADEVAASDLRLGSDVDSLFTDAEAALSTPDLFGAQPEPTDGQFTLSLGTGGSATFRFTDNFLTGSDSSAPDLVIFETGASESVRVEISRDGKNFTSVGVASGVNNTIDIDQFGFSSVDRFAFVRLTDLVTPLDEPTDAFGPAGADIDAIGALSTVPAEQYVPGSQGIVVTQNSGPTLLNNVVANFQTGIAVSDRSSDFNTDDVDRSKELTVLGGNTYFRNAFNANGSSQEDLGLFSQIISDFQQLFVDPTTLVFAPQDNVPTIDSAIDSLEDRASLVTVRRAVGLSPIPILAPILDLNGQLRIDDPDVDNSPGVGLRVFKDRGAEDRADDIGPRVTLISPRADDLLRDSGRVVTIGTIFDSFDIQLIDGITPADPGSGVGVDDISASNGALIRLTRLQAGSQITETLVEGIDYRYAYEAADNTIRLTPIAGIWQDNSVYTIEILGDDVGIIQGERATGYADGAITQVDIVSQVGPSEVINRRSIELDTGIGVSIASSGLVLEDITGAQMPNIQGQTLAVFDGFVAEPIEFVLTTTNDPAINEAIVSGGGVPVRVGERATAEQIAAAVASAINQSELKLLAIAVGNRIQLRDSVVKTTALFRVSGAAAYLGADVSLAPEIRGVNVQGQMLRVFDGDNEVTFTLATDPSQVTSGTPVIVSPTARAAEIAEAIEIAIDVSGLRLATTVNEDVLELRGLSDRVDPDTALSFARSVPTTGNPLNEAFKITNYSLDAVLTDAAIAAVDGLTITIFDGQTERTFEFDNQIPPAGVPAVQPGNLAIPVGANPTSRELLAALRDSVSQTELRVQVVAAARSFRITGTTAPISLTSSSGGFIITGLGAIGTSPGFGIGIPSDGQELSDAVDEGQSFVITRGPIATTFEVDFDGIQEVEGATLVTASARTLDAVADAIALAINNAQLGLLAANIDGGRVTLSGVETENVQLNLLNSVFFQLGIAGLPTPSAVVVPLDATEEEIAIAYEQALDDFALLGVERERIGDRVIVRSAVANQQVLVSGTSVIEQRISDEVGNQAGSSDEGLSPLVIFVGGGLDYGDAPSPYASTAAQGGPRHVVDINFALWRPMPGDPNDRPITPDADAQLPNLDEDNGVRLVGTLQPGFSANFEVSIHNPDARQFFVDAWFDWNANGLFELDELRRFGSAGTGRPLLSNGSNVISVSVPAGAVVGETYARFRLSQDANLGPGGDAASGEVEDIRLLVSNNPFQNPVLRHDVNNSGIVTPLDSLQIINAIGRNDGDNILLDVPPLPVGLPPFPDVSGDSVVSRVDALQVINELARMFNTAGGLSEQIGEGEATSYLPLTAGVMASGATVLGDLLMAEQRRSATPPSSSVLATPSAAEVSTITPRSASKTSVFDSAPQVALDSIVQSLAEDTASLREPQQIDALDRLFASL